jgi:mono/diheme cytochrome c family protein
MNRLRKAPEFRDDKDQERWIINQMNNMDLAVETSKNRLVAFCLSMMLLTLPPRLSSAGEPPAQEPGVEITSAEPGAPVSSNKMLEQLEGEMLDRASAIFEDRCSVCHESDGNAEDSALNLVDAHWNHGDTLPEVERVIAEGIDGTKMKPNKEKLTPEEIRLVALYVLDLNQRQQLRDEAFAVLQSERSGSSTEHELVDLRIIPESRTLRGRLGGQRFVVLGTFADGLERDLTEIVSFEVSDPTLALIDPGGHARVVADGQVIVSAAYQNRTVEAQLTIEGSGEQRPINFVQDISGILTRQGCNTTDCHGSVKGKGGLKLSMNALYPREDHKWILEGGEYQVLTTEPGGDLVPRINLEEPEQSLLLTKPSMAVEHDGGLRLKADSLEHQMVLQWIQEGAVFGEEGKSVATVEKIEVFPHAVVMNAGDVHQLLVTAHFSDGHIGDFTDKVLFMSNNEDVAKVDSDGQVRAVRTGETGIMIRTAGHVGIASVGVIAAHVSDYPVVPRHNFIDEHAFSKLEKFNIIPSDLCSDEDFLRRVCLDVAGRLPPPARVKAFLDDTNPDKRNKLIDTLFESPEYVDYWTFRLAEIFRVSLYHAGFSSKGTKLYHDWIRGSIAHDKPYDQIARERIAAQGYDGPSRHYAHWPVPESIMAEDVRVFMGRRMDCAQCHDHPFESWSQDQFWGLTSFYGHVRGYGTAYYSAPVTDLPGGNYDHGKGGPVLHPRTKEEVQPAFLDGVSLTQEERDDPRQALAKWMTDHPYFAEATVNRVWGTLFGRGIVDPVDDFRSTNPPTHPELLEALARDFRKHNHSLKHLIRTIVQSRAYQLSSMTNSTNSKDTTNYSHWIPKRLDAEVMLDAISDITGVPEVFRYASGGGAQLPVGTRALQLRESDTYPCRFLDIHGRTNREMVPERDNTPNVLQALHQLAGRTYTRKFETGKNRVDSMIEEKLTDSQMIETFCLATLSRFPSEQETSQITSMIAVLESRRDALQDALWGLLNSSEFMYNH